MQEREEKLKLAKSKLDKFKRKKQTIPTQPQTISPDQLADSSNTKVTSNSQKSPVQSAGPLPIQEYSNQQISNQPEHEQSAPTHLSQSPRQNQLNHIDLNPITQSSQQTTDYHNSNNYESHGNAVYQNGYDQGNNLYDESAEGQLDQYGQDLSQQIQYYAQIYDQLLHENGLLKQQLDEYYVREASMAKKEESLEQREEELRQNDLDYNRRMLDLENREYEFANRVENSKAFQLQKDLERKTVELEEREIELNQRYEELDAHSQEFNHHWGELEQQRLQLNDGFNELNAQQMQFNQAWEEFENQKIQFKQSHQPPKDPNHQDNSVLMEKLAESERISEKRLQELKQLTRDYDSLNETLETYKLKQSEHLATIKNLKEEVTADKVNHRDYDNSEIENLRAQLKNLQESEANHLAHIQQLEGYYQLYENMKAEYNVVYSNLQELQSNESNYLAAIKELENQAYHKHNTNGEHYLNDTIKQYEQREYDLQERINYLQNQLEKQETVRSSQPNGKTEVLTEASLEKLVQEFALLKDEIKQSKRSNNDIQLLSERLQDIELSNNRVNSELGNLANHLYSQQPNSSHPEYLHALTELTKSNNYLLMHLMGVQEQGYSNRIADRDYKMVDNRYQDYEYRQDTRIVEIADQPYKKDYGYDKSRSESGYYQDRKWMDQQERASKFEYQDKVKIEKPAFSGSGSDAVRDMIRARLSSKSRQ